MMAQQSPEIKKLQEELLKAGQEIERLSKIKSDFVSIISHELRTPLTSIKESVSLILDGVAGPVNEDQKKFLEIAKNNIERLIKIIMDILDFSKLEAGRLTMHKRKLNINDIIKDVYKATEQVMEQNKIRFSMGLSDRIEKTWFDPDRIGQVLKNLISNAVKFNKKEGGVVITTEEESIDGGERIKVCVEDTGIGISEEEFPNLFKHFTPLDSSITRRHPGAGLGLAICKGIMDYHCGDIWVESKKGLGSRFYFTLPIYTDGDEFNFLLDEAMDRARYNGLKLSLIFFTIRNHGDLNRKKLSEIEHDIRSSLRGPEDKVVSFDKEGMVGVIAGTDRNGAMKMIERIRPNVRISLNFGIAVYPDEVETKEDLVRESRGGMMTTKNFFSEIT